MGNEKTGKILIIAAGSASTELAVYENGLERARSMLAVPAEASASAEAERDSADFRCAQIQAWIRSTGFEPEDFSAFICRRESTEAFAAGVFRLNSLLAGDADSRFGPEASDLGCTLCRRLGNEAGIPAFAVSQPVSFESIRLAAYFESAGVLRPSALPLRNQTAVARRLAATLDMPYERLKALVVNMGETFSVAAHQKGKMIDITTMLDEDWSFVPENFLPIPVFELVQPVVSCQAAVGVIPQSVRHQGGLAAYLGNASDRQIEERIRQGDELAASALETISSQIAKEIGASATALRGEVAAIALTGNLAHWSRLVSLIKERVSFLAPIFVYPGEDELETLAFTALRWLRGESRQQKYTC